MMTHRLLFATIVVFCPLPSWSSISTPTLSPIIFIPGSFCSLLEVRIDTTLQPSCPKSWHNQWIVLWLNVRLFEPTHLPCFHQVFRWIYDERSKTFDLPPGVETRLVPKAFNDSFLRGVLWEYLGLDTFRSHFISKFGYQDGLNLRSIAYDFRRGNQENLLNFSAQMKALIESTYLDNGNTSVHLVSHSTGGSMTLFFLSEQDQAWKDRYIRSWISLSGNFAGEIDNIANVVQGFLTPIIPREVIQSWDFFAWRLPEPTIYGSKRVIVQTPLRNFTAFEMMDLLLYVNASALASVYPTTSAILASLPPPNVRTYCFFGTNISTPIGYRLERARLEQIDGLGDGEQDDTTNRSCQLWNTTMDYRYPLIIKEFDHVRHTELVSNQQVLQEIGKIVSMKQY